MARSKRGVGPLLTAALAGVAVVASGCQFDGVNEMALPGGKGTGADAVVVTVEFPDVGTLTPNSQVKVDDIAVGTVTAVDVENWHAVATLSIDKDIEIPANAVAKVGVNTLLGASFVELAAPRKPKGRLATGDLITLARSHAYPSTEQVLSAASVALNGGGLEQISTITTELNRVLGSNDGAFGELLPRLESFVTTLNDQKDDILAAIRDVAHMSKKFADQSPVINRALDEIGPALEVLAKDRPDITEALVSLTELSDVATPLVKDIKDDLVADLRDIEPALRAIESAGDQAVSALGFMVTFPFAPETVGNACSGDYCNLNLILDLTNSAITNGFITPDGSLGIPGLPGIDLTKLLDALGLTNTVDGITGLIEQLVGGKNPAAGSKTGKNGKAGSDDPDDTSGGGLSGLLGLLGLGGN